MRDGPGAEFARSALLVGATGLVGGHLMELLAAEPCYERVVVLVRRQANLVRHAKIEQHVIDFDALQALPPHVRADHVFCALGTTIRSAGSASAFRKVDFDYPIRVADLMLKRGARHFLVVSSMGANSKARVFYSRVKGEMEQAVLGLPYPAKSIFRPSLLLGERKEFRLAEAIATRLGFLMPPAYKPIEARTVAAAMIAVAKTHHEGARIIESAEIASIAASP